MVLSIIWSKKVNEVGHSRIEAIMILNMIWYKNVKSLVKRVNKCNKIFKNTIK